MVCSSLLLVSEDDKDVQRLVEVVLVCCSTVREVVLDVLVCESAPGMEVVVVVRGGSIGVLVLLVVLLLLFWDSVSLVFEYLMEVVVEVIVVMDSFGGGAAGELREK